MKINVSNGEIVDKLTILEIKAQKIRDIEKLKNIHIELSQISEAAREILPLCQSQYLELRQVNEALWTIEDQIRLLEQQQDFGAEFISLARSVYLNNDKRARIKKDINLATGSELTEEKSYQDY